MSGRYFIVAKGILSNSWQINTSLNKKFKNLKFYEIKKKSEIKKEKKDLVSKLDTLESEYKGICFKKFSRDLKKYTIQLNLLEIEISSGINLK